MSIDEARAVHRIVRAIHDGECPKCRSLHLATEMWTERIVFDGKQQLVSGWQCPQCGFFVTEAEGMDAIAAQGFSEDLAVFRRWRTLRVVQAAPAREDWRVAKPLELSPIATSPPADTPTTPDAGRDRLTKDDPAGDYSCDLLVEPRCGFCGTKLTLVRPGSHQCDNPECESNQ